VQHRTSRLRALLLSAGCLPSMYLVAVSRLATICGRVRDDSGARQALRSDSRPRVGATATVDSDSAVRNVSCFSLLRKTSETEAAEAAMLDGRSSAGIESEGRRGARLLLLPGVGGARPAVGCEDGGKSNSERRLPLLLRPSERRGARGAASSNSSSRLTAAQQGLMRHRERRRSAWTGGNAVLGCAADLAVDAPPLPLLDLSAMAEGVVATGCGFETMVVVLSFCCEGCCCCCWRSMLLMSRSGRDSRIGR
jgi:hypothetical protein